MSSVPTQEHKADRPRLERSFSTRVDIRGLAKHQPDIANQLDASWSDIALTAGLLEQLLVSDDVLSLPPTIASDLLRLYEYYVRHRPSDSPNTTWELPVSGFRDLQPVCATCGSSA
jgi:hypothetical protein